MDDEIKSLSSEEFTEKMMRLICGDKYDAFMKRRAREIEADGGPAAHHAKIEERKKKELQQTEIRMRSEYTKRLLMKSGLGAKFFSRTFNTFKTTPENEKAKDVCEAIASGRQTRGVILSGDNGIGKTHLAAAIVNYMAEHGKRPYFGNIVDIKDEVMDNFKTGTEKVYHKFLDCDLMVIDDLGAEHAKSDSGWIDSLLYKIVNRAYESNKTLVITTNLSNFDFAKRYNDRINSRLHEMCEWIEFTDRDRRMDGFVETDEPMPEEWEQESMRV